MSWAGLWAAWVWPVLPVSQSKGSCATPNVNTPLLLSHSGKCQKGVCCRPWVPVGVTPLLPHEVRMHRDFGLGEARLCSGEECSILPACSG